jgi:hypothetical protein
MQIKWRGELKKGMLGFAVAYAAWNMVGVLCDKGMERTPVDIAVSVLDANTSGPVSHAVVSWQRRARDIDCQRIVSLLNESAEIRSSEGGILSPSEHPESEFAFVSQELGVPDDGIPMTVIGMTTKNGRLEFRAYLGRKLKWIWPRIGPVDARNRVLQVNAVGYRSKLISIRPEDLALVEGEYRVNITVLLDPETAPR